MVRRMDDRRRSVRILVGMTIATIGLESSALAVPQPAPILVSQTACVVIKTTAVYTTANRNDPEVLPKFPLVVNTLVALATPLPSEVPSRIQIKQPSNGFVDYAALDCGRSPIVLPPDQGTNPSLQKTSACRTVGSGIILMVVRQEPSRIAPEIDAVRAGQIVYVTQTGGGTTSRTDANGEVWVEVDLQRTFRRNFGLSSGFGWLSNSEPGDRRTTLVNGCP